MDGVQLPQGHGHFEEAVYFLPFSSQKFMVLILSTSEGWKTQSTLEPPSGFEHGTPGLGIQRLTVKVFNCKDKIIVKFNYVLQIVVPLLLLRDTK